MAEQPSRKRRSVRRAVLYAAAFVLSLSGCVSSYLGFYWLFAHGSIPKPTALFLSQTVYAPVRGYYAQQYPGWKYLWTAERHVYWWGRGVPMPEPHRRQLDQAWGRSSDVRPEPQSGED